VAAKSGSTTVAAYAYDALGRRITETYSGTNTTNHLYYSPQWQVIEERQNGTGTSNVSYQYVWGAAYVDSLVLRDTYSGGVKTQRLYAQQNANDDVTALINTSGQVQERYLYDPYGAVTITDANWNPRTGNVSSFGWQYLHQGGRLDAVTGWYGFRNRDLIPSEGRWAERDPLGFGGGDLNLYRCLADAPAHATDPGGLAAAQSTDPNAGTGPGDLLILSRHYPGNDPNPGDGTKTDPDFEAAAARRRFYLAPDRPATLDDLTEAINKAVKANGGPFKRIILISHAGGPANGPAACMRSSRSGDQRMNDVGSSDPNDPERLRNGHITGPLSGAINRALTPNGVFVLATCGYYEESDNRRYRDRFKNNLKAMARQIGHPFYADALPSNPDPEFGSRTHDSRKVDTGVPHRVGADPDGPIHELPHH